MTSAMPQQKPPAADVTTTVLEPNDVVCGRGELAVSNPGNVRFRLLVEKHRSEYRDAQRRLRKDAIARAIVQEIQERGGRFLQRAEHAENRKRNGSVTTQQRETGKQSLSGAAQGTTSISEVPWELADEEVVLLKVKQALRGKKQAVSDHRPSHVPSSMSSQRHSSQQQQPHHVDPSTIASAHISRRQQQQQPTATTATDLRSQRNVENAQSRASVVQPEPNVLESLIQARAWLALQAWQQRLAHMESVVGAPVVHSTHRPSSELEILLRLQQLNSCNDRRYPSQHGLFPYATNGRENREQEVPGSFAIPKP